MIAHSELSIYFPRTLKLFIELSLSCNKNTSGLVNSASVGQLMLATVIASAGNATVSG